MINNSIKLAIFWIGLNEIKTRLNNEIIPVAGYLGVEDADLIIAMEELSVKIDNHLE
jgi:hypothetical protein